MKEPISIGATATVQYLGHIKTYLATGAGVFDGAIWAQHTSEWQELGDGRSQSTMIHEFTGADGSRLSTTDVAVAIPVPGTEEISLTVQHTVVDATGRGPGGAAHSRASGFTTPRQARECNASAES